MKTKIIKVVEGFQLGPSQWVKNTVTIRSANMSSMQLQLVPWLGCEGVKEPML